MASSGGGRQHMKSSLCWLPSLIVMAWSDTSSDWKAGAGGWMDVWQASQKTGWCPTLADGSSEPKRGTGGGNQQCKGKVSPLARSSANLTRPTNNFNTVNRWLIHSNELPTRTIEWEDAIFPFSRTVFPLPIGPARVSARCQCIMP